MHTQRRVHLGTIFILFTAVFVRSAQAEIRVTVGHRADGSNFAFESVPAPVSNDAAKNAKFTLLEGTRDANGGELAVLHDGRLPASADAPADSFFFAAGTQGGRIRLDLGHVLSVKQVATYSWHTGLRAPQLYRLYAADGSAEKFQSAPPAGTDPATCGWTLVGRVDTRPGDGTAAGQYGVSIADGSGPLGKYRYLLFDVSPTAERDRFANTFFSEIDVIDADAPAPLAISPLLLQTFTAEDGKYQFTIDLTAAPDRADWCREKLQPLVQEWYPRIVALLPSEGYSAPTKLTLQFRTDMGVVPASAGGAHVNLNAPWFRSEQQREALGAVVHELVHVVQSYPGPREKPQAEPTPGWIVEGIADYVRWYLYEPQSKGAELTPAQLAAARHDASYRVTANFLDWVSRKHDRELVPKLNAASRAGKYSTQLWTDRTGLPLSELAENWKQMGR